MDLNLSGKVALVTGGSLGIGRAVARLFAAEGGEVAISARREEHLNAAAIMIKESTGREVLSIVADQTKDEDIVRMTEETVAHFGGLDCLIISAGVSIRGDFLTLSEEETRHDIDLSFMGVHRCCRAAIPHMQKRGGGRIIIMAAVAGMAPLLHIPGTSAVNAAQINIGKNYSKLFGKDNILVNTINLGPIFTEMAEAQCEVIAKEMGITYEEAIKMRGSRTALGRNGTAEEAAAITVFLCSEQASYITGAAIEVDGGAANYI
jgi:NAD(P)-dependent dehydrogenase (short-subunit alcohol dehydrogenase family)